jgi:hypothetical protein
MTPNEHRRRRRTRTGAAALVASVALGGCMGLLGDPGVRPGEVPGTCNSMAPVAPTRIARLTHAQYNNVVHDLLYVDSRPADMFQVDPGFGTFQNEVEHLVVEPALARDYRRAAEQLAADAVTNATTRARIVGCTPTGDGSACARQFITSFLRRAYRRPATQAELDAYVRLYGMAPQLSTTTDAFAAGVQLVIETVLQSPNFLYRVELSRSEGLPGLIALGDHEVAARLALMLWNTLPDDALAAAADAHQLSTTEQVATQARRMLDDPRGHAMVGDFHAQLFDTARDVADGTLMRNMTMFPNFTRNAGVAMQQETARFVDEVVYAQHGDFALLMTAPYTFVNQDLARIYGLSGTFGADFQRVDLNPAQRSGILTQVGFLASHAFSDTTDPIRRGVFVQRRLLCTVIGDPPPGANMTALPMRNAMIRTTREQVTVQTSADTCASCHHRIINPTGFAFENYDAIGGFRTMDNNVAVDTTGSIEIDGRQVPFTNAVELAQAIANSTTANNCYVANWMSYVFERELRGSDSCTVSRLGQQLHAVPSYTTLDLLRDLTQTETFRYRPVQEAP